MLSLIYGPHPIFQQKSDPITVFDQSLKNLVEQLFALLHQEQGIGLAAPMAGKSKQVIVINLENKRIALINPTITYSSSATKTTEEASLSFPGISALVTRPESITVNYSDIDGNAQTLDASGTLAIVIQHEMDYLEGKTFLHYISKMKRDLLIKKTQKFQKMYPPHVHGEHCNH